MSDDDDESLYEQDGEAAREIAKYLPFFPFKGIPRFYDIGAFLYEPHVFQRIVDIFVSRYRKIEVDVIAGYVTQHLSIRGRLTSSFGSFIALILNSPLLLPDST
jgi:adenine phosphoribosyltransferase